MCIRQASARTTPLYDGLESNRLHVTKTIRLKGQRFYWGVGRTFKFITTIMNRSVGWNKSTGFVVGNTYKEKSAKSWWHAKVGGKKYWFEMCMSVYRSVCVFVSVFRSVCVCVFVCVCRSVCRCAPLLVCPSRTSGTNLQSVHQRQISIYLSLLLTHTFSFSVLSFCVLWALQGE